MSRTSCWDCDPSLCHDECELRHLDDIEKEVQQKGNKIQKPSVVVTASRDMGRTASTWVFNAVRLLYRQARDPCDSYWVRQLSKQKIESRLASADDNERKRHVLIKTHEWTPHMTKEEFQELLPLVTHVIVSVRRGFPPDDNWMKYATHVLHYENIVGAEQVQKTLREIAEHLGISSSLSDEDIKEVDYNLMALPTPKCGSDPVTKLWFFHGRKGGRKLPE